MARPITTAESRLWNRISINPSTLCWEWQGACEKKGYGAIRNGGRKGKLLKVHRLVYALTRGEIPETSELDHLCRNKKCCNPAHLEAVTHSINMLRAVPFRKPSVRTRATKTHCANGHEYTLENTYVWKGYRTCRKCNLLYTHIRRGKIRKDQAFA